MPRRTGRSSLSHHFWLIPSSAVSRYGGLLERRGGRGDDGPARDWAIGLTLGGAALVIVGAGLATPYPAPSATPDVPLPGGRGTRQEARGIDRPSTVPAAGTPLPDDEPVVGVVAAGTARAYRLGGMDTPARHVVNDVLGGRPVTVTYCNRTGCARVLTGSGGGPLGVGVGGYLDGLVLTLGGRFYRQDDLSAVADGPAPACPLADLGFERTTWGAWRRAHPDTDLYLGPS